MAGRNPKYSTQHLTSELQNYINEHPYKLIKYSDLAKTTKVPAYIWRDNKAINEIISKMNSNPIINIQPNKEITFPSAEELVSANYKNKKKLISAIQSYTDILNDIYSKAKLADTFKEKEQYYINALKEKDVLIKNLKVKVNSLEEEIDICYINSQSPKIRNELGIKKNLVDFNPVSKQLSKDLDELAASMSSIFADID